MTVPSLAKAYVANHVDPLPAIVKDRRISFGVAHQVQPKWYGCSIDSLLGSPNNPRTRTNATQGDGPLSTAWPFAQLGSSTHVRYT